MNKMRCILIALFVTACSGSNTPVEKTAAQSPKGDKKIVACEKIAGKWTVHEFPKGKGKEPCKKAPCGVYTGPVELTCTDQKVGGRVMLGMSSKPDPPVESWVPFSSESKDGELSLAFMKDECEIKYIISEFEESTLFGRSESKGCKIGTKNVIYNGDLVFKRTETSPQDKPKE